MDLGAKYLSCIAITAFLLSSCIDDGYDLSDVDTNVSVNVKDLIIPVNLDEITLKSVISLEEDDAIKEVNGQYAVVLKGDISSSEVKIDPFTIKKPRIETVSGEAFVGNLSVEYPANTTGAQIPADEMLIDFTILEEDATTHMKFEADGVDTSIERIEKVGMNTELTIALDFKGLEAFVDNFYMENLVLTLPKQLQVSVSDGGVYDPETGRVTFSKPLLSDSPDRKRLNLSIRNFYAEKAGAVLKDQMFSFESDCKAKGSIAIYGKNLKPNANVGALLNLRKLDYNYGLAFAGDIPVEDFSGNIDYSVDDLEVAPITIDQLPDVLNQAGTTIGLTNPQIYLKVENPLADSKVYPKVQMQMIPNSASEETFAVAFSVDQPNNTYCLSPFNPDSYFKDEESDYSGAAHVPFSNLGHLLYGDGIPTEIGINVEALAKQYVDGFKLGDYGTMGGEYTFFAPLQLENGSLVAYTDTIDGWNDEDVDAITIQSLKLTAQVVKDIPYALNIDIWPIDKDGKRMDDVKGTASLSKEVGSQLPLEMELVGNITHLDGIILKATVEAADSQVLAPSMKLQVTDVRVKATGSYEKEL